MQFPQPSARSFPATTTFGVALSILALLLSAAIPAAATQLTATPTSLSFGSVTVGQTKTLPFTLHNTGHTNTSILSVTVNQHVFKLSALSLPKVLAPGKTLTMNVAFAPTAVGAISGRVMVTTGATTLAIPLSGTGGGASKTQLTIAPTTLAFGNVTVGNPEILTLGLGATGGSVTISSVSSSSGQFVPSGVSFPVTIGAGKEVSLNVKFTPIKSGKVSATLSFKSNATNSPTAEAMSGTGTDASVSLTWIASTSQHITGYNIYRTTSKTGSYTKVNSSLNPDTSFTDTSVANGTTYYYVTTAVNSSGGESTYSNQVKAVVP